MVYAHFLTFPRRSVKASVRSWELVRVVDQHVRPKLMELAAAQPDLAVDLLLDGLPVLLLGVKVSGRPEEGTCRC